MSEAVRAVDDANSSLYLGLLGGFRVERSDGRQALATREAISDWPRRSAKTLTKLLAAHPGHALHREQIIDVLWPDVDMESALNSFAKALHAARRVLEPSLERRGDSAYLRLADSMLVLNTEHVVVDTDVFEKLAAHAMRSGEVAAYQAALAAYSGELLPEDRYETWCADRRSALVEMRLRLLVGLAEAYERLEACGEAADLLRQALREDPACEAIHRRLMRLYARMGTPDQAMRQFHICEQLLRQELDLVPQPETVSLYDAIHASQSPRQPPMLDRDQGSLPERIANIRPFVGREQVLIDLCELLTRRDEARVGMVVVSGETGVGKTRLLEEFAIRAVGHDAIVLRGPRGANGNQFTSGPFAVALENYVAELPKDDRAKLARWYPALARVVPSLRSRVPLLQPPTHDPLVYQLDLIPSIVQFLTDLTRSKPVLLILGDLNEADDVALGLTMYLAHLATRMPLLLAGALRDPDIEACTELRRMTEAMTRDRLWLRIELRCLSRAATDQLVRAAPPCAGVSDDVLTTIYELSRGNPLFVRELIDSMGGDPTAANEAIRDPRRLAARLPARTRALAASRLALMDQALRRVLGLTAAAGTTEISLGQLRAGAAALEPPLTSPVVSDALDRALGMRVLEERDGGYAFRHPVLQAALYDSLPRHRRDEFCAALAATGAKSTADRRSRR